MQVFANEEIEDDTAAVEVSEEAAESEDEAEAEEEVEEVVEVEEEVVEETLAEEPEEAEADESEAVDSIEDQVEEPVAVDEAEDEIFIAGTLTYECDDYTVTLDYSENSEIPEGTKLVVREISSDSDNAKEQKEYEEYYDKSLEQLRSEDGGDAIAKLGFARFYDITLVSDGKEIEPSEEVKVTFTYNKDSRESVNEGNNEDDAIRVIHMTESANNGAITAEPIEKKDTDLTLENKELKKAEFTAESFSVYGIVYTVDFEYEGYTYSIVGESEVMLSKLFSVLKIEESAKDAESVEFTDYSLIKIEETDDDWKLTLLKPFDTEEKLTVTLADKIIEIKVTDAAPVARVSNDDGETWTYHTDLIHNGTQQGGSTVMRGAFNQANTLSGDVIVEILMDSDKSYTLKNGFTFDNTAIKSLTIKGTDNKSTLVKDQASAPMITTEGINTVEFSNIIFSGSGNDTITKDGNGGAVNTNAKTLNVSSCDFNNCHAGYQGGGLYHNNKAGTVTIEYSTFTGCRANGPNDDIVGGGGGGVFTNAQSATVTGSTFDSCITSVRQGAGFFHRRIKTDTAGSVTVVKGCTFENCTSKWCGAGMESDAWDITIEDSSFTNCKASKGGAINVWADGQDATANHTTLNVTNCTFENCTGTDNGGAIRSTSFTSLVDSRFVGCSSNANGGAVACTNNKTEITVTDCTISNCSAKGNGGAISAAGTMKISESSGNTLIDGCSAKNGGAIQSGNLIMSGGTISNCSATAKGGAINGTAKVTMTGGTITGNTTGGESAALDAATAVSGITFSGNVVVEGNTGSSGEARDVYIGTATDRHILIDKAGLGDNANIGVYVADAAYENHGREGKRFAHTGNVQASSMNNLDKLFSDRTEGDTQVMQGTAATPESGDLNYRFRIMWPAGDHEIAPTDVDLRMMPYILILIGGAALILIKKASDRRRKDEDDTDETEE